MCSILSRSQPEAVNKQCRYAQLKPESHDCWDKRVHYLATIPLTRSQNDLGSRMKRLTKHTSPPFAIGSLLEHRHQFLVKLVLNYSLLLRFAGAGGVTGVFFITNNIFLEKVKNHKELSLCPLKRRSWT